MKKIYSTSSLPNQFTNKSRKKNDDLAKMTVDALERIAYNQVKDNYKLGDYYKMLEGKLVWADYSDEDVGTIDAVKKLVSEDVDMPSFVKHYDLLGIIVNQLVGEWLESQDDFNIDCTDNYTDNEYLRERTRKLNEYFIERFNLEVKRVMAEQGVSEEQEFESEEEQQAYIEQINLIKNSIKTPEDIEREMKSWKTEAVEWANAVVENDSSRHRMEQLVRTEMTDYALTGRFFRNYFIGYDYYKPERWHPQEVFFSREADAIKPQDREYVGRQLRLPLYQVRERYGHLLKKKDLETLNNYYSHFTEGNKKIALDTVSGINTALFPDRELLPFYNYKEYEGALATQDITGLPMGTNIVQTPDGEQEIPYYLDYDNQGTMFGYNYVGRTDFDVRTDGVLVTEGYYRSVKNVWIASYTDDMGIKQTEIFSDELLPEFIKEKELSKDNKSSLEEVMKELKDKTIFSFPVPVIRQFLKINIGAGGNKGAIYYDDELPYQIKGLSNFADVMIPVAGIIDSNCIANKIRPYQISYNICLNQITNMMEKELGLFFLFDINLLPDSAAYGTTDEAIMKLHDFIKTSSIAPIDMHKNNTGYTSPQSNSTQIQDLSYTNHINSRLAWAENYKRLAVEQIGMTNQRLGNPSQYETAEGVKQGVEASYAQTEDKFSKMTQAYLEGLEVHLAVAQYCQKNYKDADYIYTKSDNTRGYVHLSDEAFPLRRFGVMPVNNSKNKFQRQNLISTLLNLNTLGADILDYAEIFTAKSTQEILEAGKRARKAKEKAEEAQRQARQEEIDKQIASAESIAASEREFEANEKEKDRRNKIQVAELAALGRAAYTENTSDDAKISQVAEQHLKEESFKLDSELKKGKLRQDGRIALEKLNLEKEALAVKKDDIAQKREKSANDLGIARVNWKQ